MIIITVKYKTRFKKGEQTFKGKNANEKSLKFARKLANDQIKLRLLELKARTLVTGAYLKVEFIHKTKDQL